ncbi:50S ribosomal protein L4 [Candidatus Dojkabacteria bacterium]|uniref:50S ribosomal protein L4 n=1 Tax=Candidatus Dojkabacteria bacterium TaxID=2099670 RepID=A0A847VE72_9BACT|nr:50S ribosomal protein L4 [Candidatus Dojkabacteria bacterium]
MVSKKLNKRLLVVSDDEKLNSALRNMEGIKIVQPMKVNVKNLVEARDILIDINSIDILEKRLTNGE